MFPWVPGTGEGFLALAGAALGWCWGHGASMHTRQRELSRMLSQTHPNPSCAPQRLQQPQGRKPRRPLEQGIVLGVKFNTPLPGQGRPARPRSAGAARLGEGRAGALPCQGGCRRAAELVHVSGSAGASPGSEASLALPKRQLEFPEPAQHPQGKPDSEGQPKNSCPGHKLAREKGK